jgi:hypothetical protein
MSNSEDKDIVVDDGELFDIPENIEKEFQKKLKELEEQE